MCGLVFPLFQHFPRKGFQLWVKDNCVVVTICQDVGFACKQSELFSTQSILWKSVGFCTRVNPITVISPLISRHYFVSKSIFLQNLL